MSGRSAYYVEMVARAGLIGIHTVAAPPMVAPLGGARAALGTNPIAFGFPMDGDPLVIDLGTSAFMGTDLQFRQRLGIPLPEGVAIDERGRPTTDAGGRATRRDPAVRRAQGLRAGARHARARRALQRGRPTEESTGYLFIAFKPDLFVPLEDYRRALAAEIAASRRRRGKKASTRSASPASARIASARVSRARASRSTGASRTR